MLCEAKHDQDAIECRFSAAFVAHQLRDLLERELRRLNALDPPLIRDTLSDEQGIYFWTPIELTEARDVYRLRIQGSVRSWNGTEYLSDGYLTDVVTIELFDSGDGSLVTVTPAFDDFRGFGEHVGALIAHQWGIEEAGIRKPAGRPRLEDLSEDEKAWRRDKARKYLERIEAGCTKQFAAYMVGERRRTLERWADRLLEDTE